MNKKALIVLVVVVVGGFLLFRSRGSSSVLSNQNEQIEVSKPSATKEINRVFEFPLKNGKGEEVSKLKFEIEKADIRSEIVVQGKKHVAVKGREYLILNLKVTNEYEKAVEINTRDYVRLSVNGNQDEWLAPDIHNDPVEVQALSTKLTRVGFPVDTTDKDFVLRVGEIKGEKEDIKLDIR